MTRRLTLPTVLIAVGLLYALPAQAGIFDDDVARKQISDLQKSTSQMLIDQSRLMEQMNRDVAELRGHIELLVNQVTLLEKRQKDLYLDLDNRLQPIEAGRLKAAPATPTAPKPSPQAPIELKPVEKAAVAAVVIPQTPPVINAEPQTPPVDPVAALKAYESALDLFKAGRYKDAVNAFNQFNQNFGSSEQAPAAEFWLGNSYYALGDCVQVIISQQKLLAKWPNSARASDAMTNIATCQAELGQKTESQKTLRDLISRYPDSKAAAAAKLQIR